MLRKRPQAPLARLPANSVAAPAARLPATGATAPAAPEKQPLVHQCRLEAIYKNPHNRKEGTFDGSVVLSPGRSHATLYDSDGKSLGQRSLTLKQSAALFTGSTHIFGKWEAELLSDATTSGSPLASDPAVTSITGAPREMEKSSSALSRRPSAPLLVVPSLPSATAETTSSTGVHTSTGAHTSTDAHTSTVAARAQVAKRPVGGAGRLVAPFVPPATAGSSAAGVRNSAGGAPSQVAKRPAGTGRFAALAASRSAEPADTDIVLNRGDAGAKPVVVDRQIARQLRPWQVEGVQFLYDCTTGRRTGLATGLPLSGAILAHAPGCGKTLQALALIFTMLKSGPSGHALIKKACVVCPASLCRNWEAECKRWLPHRLTAHVLPPAPPAAAALAAADFSRCPPRQLLVLSYEAARTHCAVLERAGIGLVICDEGHRLKSIHGNQTIDALQRIGKARRVILTGMPLLLSSASPYPCQGTPLQNDLKEFWALGDFVARGELGEMTAFTQSISRPIDVGRQPGASASAREAAEAAMARLRALSEPFIQRRDASVMAAILPPRTELVMFTSLTPAHSAAYAIKAREADAAPHVLATISELRGLCSHAGGERVDESSKLVLLMRLLPPLRAACEKVVVCSAFNRSLDMIEAAIRARGWPLARVDGTTPRERRQLLVDRFNSLQLSAPGASPHGTSCDHGSTGACEDDRTPFVFLLATKAGGVGFNLVGASRLVMWDPEWNPALDTQAMGRVYRQGQSRPVIIWRLFAAGTIEELMYMRQLFKQELNTALATSVDEDSEGGMADVCDDTAELRQSFAIEDLRRLFEFDGSGQSVTLRALLEGQPERAATMSAPAAWVSALPDPTLRTALESDAAVRGALTYAVDAGILEGLRDETDARHRAAYSDRAAEAAEAEAGLHQGESTGVCAYKPLHLARGGSMIRAASDSPIYEDGEEDEEEMDEEDHAFIVDDSEEEEEEEESGGGGVSELEMDSDKEVPRPRPAPAPDAAAQCKKQKRARVARAARRIVADESDEDA